MQIKKVLTKKNVWNVFFIALFLIIILVPSAKALVMQGLMEIGLFTPSIDPTKNTFTAKLSAIKFKDSKNNMVILSDFEGKIVFINFWATWCPPCLAEMRSINKLYQQFGNEDVVFLLIDADGNFAKAQAYFDRKNYKMPVYTFASSLPKEIYSGSLPTTLVFDKKGRIAYNGVGAANYASPKFIAFIKELKALKD